MANPTLFPEPFANAGAANTIPKAATGTNLASLDEGFPPITSEDPALGGLPPVREDFNGILKEITQHLVFLGKGGRYIADTVWTTGAGYDVGDTLRDDSGNGWDAINLNAANTLSPNSAAAYSPAGGWDFMAVRGPSTKFGRLLFLSDNSTAANAVILADSYYTDYRGGAGAPGTMVAWVNAIANTGATTIIAPGKAGDGTQPLQRSDGTALQAGDLQVGQLYIGIYTGTAVRLLNRTYAQAAPSTYMSEAGAASSVSATGTMAGIGTALHYTPTRSGLVQVTMEGVLANTVACNGQVQPKYGTGTAPAAGAAPVGTAPSSSRQVAVPANASNYGIPFSFSFTIQLTVGTAYWFDFLLATSAGTLNLVPAAKISLVEF